MWLGHIKQLRFESIFNLVLIKDMTNIYKEKVLAQKNLYFSYIHTRSLNID